MTPNALKASILQLAIQGKLVEQRPEEGSAEELYRRIQAAKGSKGSKGSKRLAPHPPQSLPPKTPSPADAPFDIPESWRWVRLGSVASIERGSGIKRSETSQTGFPCVRYGEIYTTYGYSFTHTKSFVPESVASSCHMAEHGDVLCTLTGEWKEEIAKATAYLGENPVAIGGDLAKISSAAYNPLLLVYFFFAPFMIQQKASKANGTMIVHIGKDAIANLLIPLPPLAEQKRIVAKIEELLPLIDRYAQAWSKLEDFNKRFPGDMQKSLLQMAIQGKLVEQRPEEGTGEELYRQIKAEKQRLVKAGKLKKEKPLPEIAADEIPFEIPESWKWVRIANVWSVLNGDRGKNYPAKSTLSKTGIPFISALNLDGRTVVNDDRLLCLSEKQYDLLGNGKLNKGDVVVCIRGSLGKHGRYPFERGAIASSLVILRSQLQLPVLDDFLLLYLDAPLFFCEIKRFDNGTAQPNLAAKSLEQFLFPLPPLAEQKRIVAKLEELLPLCERLK